MSVPRLRLSLVLFLAAGHIVAQDCSCPKADSLRPIIGRYFNTGKLDSAAYVLDQLKNNNNPVCNIVNLDGIAQVSISRKDYAKARGLLKAEETLQLKLGCSKLLIRFYNTMSRYYQETSQPDSSSMMSLRALQFAEQEREWYAAARASTNLAAIFHQQKQDSKALYYNLRALSFARNSGDSVILAAVLNRTSDAYLARYRSVPDRKLLDSVFVLSLESVRVSRNRPANLIEAPGAYTQLSNYFFERAQYSLALQYADSAIRLCPKGIHDFDRHLLNAYYAKSRSYFKSGDYPQAHKHADSAYYYAQRFNIQLAVDPLKHIYEITKAQGDFKTAVWAHERMTQIRDSLFTLEKTQTINELERKYTQAKNEQTIRELTQEKQISSLKIKLLIIAILAALVIIVLTVIIYRYSLLKQRQQTRELKYRLSQALINPHFLSNALVSIQRFMLENNAGEASLYLTRFSRLMRQMLEHSRKEFVSLDEEIELLTNYAALQKLRFKDSFDFEIRVAEALRGSDSQIPPMFIQPFIENAIEHGVSKVEKGNILVSLVVDGRHLRVTITDNGPGLADTAHADDSLSIQIVRERIEVLNKSTKGSFRLSVRNNPSATGVCVELQLPIYS